MVKERLKSPVGRVYFLNAENLLAAFIYYPLKTLTSTSEVNLPVKLLWITVDHHNKDSFIADPEHGPEK